MLNGTQFMSANGVFALMRAFAVSKRADLIAALSLEAFDGRIDPFMDCIQQMRPHPGQIETGDAFRRILEGSELISRKKEHVQDPEVISTASRWRSPTISLRLRWLSWEIFPNAVSRS